MPRGRRRSPSSSETPDSDDDLFANRSSQPRSKSQKTSTQAIAAREANMQENVLKMVKYVLPYASTKLPVKRVDMINQTLNGDGSNFANVLSKGKKALQETYKLDLIDLKRASVKQFIVVSIDSAIVMEEYHSEQWSEMILLYLVLSYIYMKDGEVSQNALNEFLERFDMNYEESHEYFGNVKHLIQNVFTKQHYLAYVKQRAEGDSEEKITIKWGERAEYEFIKAEILEFVAELLNVNPNMFLKAYEEAYGIQDETEDLNESVAKLQMSSQKFPKSQRKRGRRTILMDEDSDDDD